MNSKSIRKELSNAVSESYNFIENLYLIRIKHIIVKRYLFYNWSIVFSSCSDSGVFFVLMLLITYFAVYHQSFREIYPFNFNPRFLWTFKTNWHNHFELEHMLPSLELCRSCVRSPVGSKQ
jgi:hypothetical protein